ncbi:TonB-dependent siderophore receptor [Rhodoferax sp.]|uniref:TonB-dependent siderophore receptor n=1 Tax=Rhodoferax sp. TaxID=50421 RepID=UPI00374DDD8E
MFRSPLNPAPLALAMALAFASLTGYAQSSASVLDGGPLPIHIDAKPLGQALNDWALQTRLQIIVQPSLVAGKQAPAVAGSLSAKQALDRLLAETGLVAVPEGNAVVVKAAAAKPEATLSAVTVTAAASVETAFSPVVGYAAKRSSTANKTDTPLSETPQSVTVVTRDQMVDQGANTMQEALLYAAGVRSDTYGLDSRSDDAAIRGSTADTYVDGLRQTNDYYTSTARADPYTLERIEVLRGPAAMLFGQGSTAGVLNLVSKRPQAEFQGEVGVQLGSYGRKQIQADITGPLTADGQWLYRLVAVGRDANTQVDYVRDDRSLLMPSLTWKPDAATSLTLQGLWQKDRSGSTSQFLPWSGILTANPNGQIPTNRFIGEPGDHYDTDRSTLGYLFEHKFNDQWTVRQNFRYAVNKVDYLTHYANSFSLPGGWYDDPVNQRVIGRYGDYTQTKVHIATIDQHAEGHLRTGAVEHTLLTGLDLTHYRNDKRSGSSYDTIDAYDPVYGLATPIELGDNVRSSQRQTGIYLQDQMKIAKDWIVVAGLRHDKVTNSVQGASDEHSQATTKRLGLMYLLPNGWSPYLSYSESFTPVAGTNDYGERFKPLRGEQIEVGVKYMPANSTTQFTAAVYKLKEKNHSTVDPNNASNSIQVDSTKNQGVELEWKAAVTRDIDAIANYSYTDVDAQLTQVSRNQASVWGKWRFAVAGVEGLALGVGVRSMSAIHDGAAPTTPAVTLLDAMLSLDQLHWRYALNVSNLTDKVYTTICLSRGDCWYGARRNVVASVTYRF